MVKYNDVHIQNNTINSVAIMEVTNANSIAIKRSYLTFKNNSGLLNSGTAILLLNGITELTVSTSSPKFSYNKLKATLSGGITFQNTRMFVYSFVKAEFKNNEGGNGGAMAFYQKSVVYAFTKERSRRVNMNFYNNMAYTN